MPLVTPINAENRRYIETKKEKMGHVYDQDGDALDSTNGKDLETTASQ